MSNFALIIIRYTYKMKHLYHVFCLTLGLFLMSLSSWAVPARPVTFTQQQPDGTTLTYRLCGDEFYHYYTTEDGVPITRLQDGSFYYTRVLGGTLTATSTLAHDKALRSAAEVGLIETYRMPLDSQIRLEHRQRVQQRHQVETEVDARASFPQRRKANFGDPHRTVGHKRGIVILIEYPDRKFATTRTKWDNKFNKEGFSEDLHKGSVRDYFRDQSYGELLIDFDVVGPYMAKEELAYYGAPNGGSNDSYPCQLVSEAVKAANADVNFADYDWDGDGYVDQVYVVGAGYGQAQGAPDYTIWPHEWHLDYGAWGGDGNGRIYADGVWVDTYALSTELGGTSGSTPDGIGTAVHEFSHCMGLPDLYDVDGAGVQTLGSWDVLDGGCYAGPNWTGTVPIGYSAYERWFSGWLTPITLDTNMPCTVKNIPNVGDSAVAYIIYNKGNKNEYYILENRQHKGWFSYPTGHGLFVTHVDYKRDLWQGDRPNGGTNHPCVIHIPADKNYNCNASDFFPGTGTSIVRTLNNTSHTGVNGKLFNKNSDGTYNMNAELTTIKEVGGLISFVFNGGEEAVKKRLKATIVQLDSLIAVPHIDTQDGATDALAAVIFDTKVIAAIDTTTQAYRAASDALIKAGVDFLYNVQPTDPEHPFDVSFTLINADISNTEGWKDELNGPVFEYANGVGQYTNAKFTLSQTTLHKMPKGNYRASVKGFQRPGLLANCADNDVNSYFFARGKSVKMHHVLEEAKDERYNSGDSRTPDMKYVPGNARAAANWFMGGMYETAIDFSTIVSTGTAIKIGVKCSSAKADYWTVFDDFRLLFYGEPQEDGTEDAIQDIPTAQPHTGNIYDLQGRRIVGKPSQGIYIQGGKKIRYTSK